jgi:hypothetical protein
MSSVEGKNGSAARAPIGRATSRWDSLFGEVIGKHVEVLSSRPGIYSRSGHFGKKGSAKDVIFDPFVFCAVQAFDDKSNDPCTLGYSKYTWKVRGRRHWHIKNQWLCPSTRSLCDAENWFDHAVLWTAQIVKERRESATKVTPHVAPDQKLSDLAD